MWHWIRKRLVLWVLGRIQLPRELLRQSFQRSAAQPALVCGGAVQTYAELGLRVDHMAGWLQAAGVGVEQPLVAWLDDEEDFIVLRLAALQCGAAFVGLSSDAHDQRVAQVMQLAGAQWLVHSPARSAQAQALLANHPTWRLLAVDAAGAKASPGMGSDTWPAIDALQVAGYSLTSGSTGAPKLVPATHAVYMTSMRLLLVGAPAGPRRVLRIVVAVPFSGAGSGVLLLCLGAGGCVIRLPRYDASCVVQAVEQHQASSLFITPSLLIDLLDYLPEHAHDLSSLTSITYGTEWMPPAKLAEALHRFGPILNQGYGCTELLPPVAGLSAPEHWVDGQPAPRTLLSALGRPSSVARLRVADAQDQTVPDGTVGELLLQSPTMFAGYAGQPELSAQVLRGGWYHSGDLAYRSVDGLFHLVGRASEVIQRRGHITYPLPVQAQMHEHEAVKNAVYVQQGDRAVMLVSLRQRYRADAATWWPQVTHWLPTRVDAFDLPDAYVLLEELPRSANGKLSRRGLS